MPSAKGLGLRLHAEKEGGGGKSCTIPSIPWVRHRCTACQAEIEIEEECSPLGGTMQQPELRMSGAKKIGAYTPHPRGGKSLPDLDILQVQQLHVAWCAHPGTHGQRLCAGGKGVSACQANSRTNTVWPLSHTLM